MAITYGEPSNRIVHFQRDHLHFEMKQFKIQNPYKKDESAHYVFVLKKLPGADDIAVENWSKVHKELKQDEEAERAQMAGLSDDDSMGDDEEEEKHAVDFSKGGQEVKWAKS